MATRNDAADEVDEDVARATTAEGRKAAAALAALDAMPSAVGAKQVDAEAMSKAMKKLKLGAAGTAAKKVKVEASDVTLLVNELDLDKTQATELLKQHEGNAIQALRAYVTA